VAEVVLGGPTVTLAPIHFVLPGLLHQVVDQLAKRDQAVVRLVLRLVLDSGHTRMVSVSVGRPTRSVPGLERIVRTRLENLKLDAPVVELAIEVEEVSGEAGWQPGLVDRTEGDEALPELLARLTDALGSGALFAAEEVDTWRPEAAWKAVPFAPDAPPAKPERPSKPDPVDALVRWESTLPCPRPTRLLSPAEPIQVRVQRGRPGHIHGRGGWERVTRCEGPERLRSDWWRPEGGFDREYWVVSTSEGASWVYREHTRWFRHGWFD
jgi:protein ImuB